ncbi:helix-turn-helix domain-containing protein [Pseudonocardia ailaonensis]|uniref:Helix-turn-helix domain-containing protein n=1 Tax=Pseudonocardia ailaonensis TaxID=367279 RepID=A0ABN2MHY4_9PSEU
MAGTVLEPPESRLPRWMEAMTESLRAINSEHDLDQVLAMIARQACELLDLQQCAVYVLDPESGTLQINGSHGLSPGYIERTNVEPMRLDEATARTGPPTARAALTGRPVFVESVFDEPGLDRWRANMAREGLRAVVAAPMRTADKSPIGTLTGYTRSERAFDTADLDQLALLSDHAAAAIVAARRRDRERAAIGALSDANEELRAQQATVARLRDLQQELTRLLLTDVGLAGIAAFLARRLDAEITIDDEDGTALAASPPDAAVHRDVPDGGARLTEVLDSGRATEIGPADTPVCLVPIPGSTSPRARMWVRRSTSGPSRPAAPFDDDERRAMEGCALLIALERSRLERRAEAEARLTKDLLADLLSPAAMVHADSVMARAAALGHDPRGSHELAVFVQVTGRSPGSRADPGRLTAALLDAARDIRPRPVVGAVGDAVVALLHTAADPLPDRRRGRALLPSLVERARQVTGGGARCVVGAVRVELANVERGLTVALHAAQLVTPASPEIVRLADFGVHGLLLESGTSERLVRFAEQTLGPIAELDRTRQSDLVATLRAWFAADMSNREAAERLFVHPNTVGYRLKRAAGAAGLDLARPADLMTLQLALVVDEIRGGVARPS